MINIFIIPQNFNFKNKFLGIVDYSTLTLLAISYSITYFIINSIFSTLNTKILIFILINGPITLLSIVGFYHENITYVLSYVIKFFINRHIYLYKKNFFDT